MIVCTYTTGTMLDFINSQSGLQYLRIRFFFHNAKEVHVLPVDQYAKLLDILISHLSHLDIHTLEVVMAPSILYPSPSRYSITRMQMLDIICGERFHKTLRRFTALKTFQLELYDNTHDSSWWLKKILERERVPTGMSMIQIVCHHG